MPTEIVKCPKCGRRFPDNPEKHRDRDKRSPCCRAVYKKAGSHLLANLRWAKEKLLSKDMKEKEYDVGLRGRAKHNLKLKQRREEIGEITEEMVEREFRELKSEEDARKALRGKGR